MERFGSRVSSRRRRGRFFSSSEESFGPNASSCGTREGEGEREDSRGKATTSILRLAFAHRAGRCSGFDSPNLLKCNNHSFEWLLL
jgi:hypothetical protein